MMSKEVEEIIQKQNYIHPSRYISGRIIEYDIKSANISMLRLQNIISQEDYERLSKMPKINREIEIGLMEKQDPSLYTAIQTGIRASKLKLADSNNIENPDVIVRIANDAVYINSPVELSKIQFGQYVLFKRKSEYRNMIRFGNIIIFIAVLENGDIDIDVKGISENNIPLHSDYILSIIVSAVTMLEYSGVNVAINYVSNICEQYLHYQLPVGFYREFSPESSYRVKSSDYFLNGFGLYDVLENQKYQLDINYNYNILRELWSILIDIYNRRNR